MRSIQRSLACLALAAALAGACGTDGAERASGGPGGASAESARAATISGTVVDAATGTPVAGVTLRGPAGSQATSDPQGRFILPDLPVGAEGDLIAEGKDGAQARNRLRPLRAGVLEVVVHLRRP